MIGGVILIVCGLFGCWFLYVISKNIGGKR